MCGPSSQMKAINQNIQQFSNQMTSEAGQIFGDSSTVFNNIMGAMQGIVNGGPGQQGFSAAEDSAMNASAVNAGAAEARNLKSAAASGVGAIGGGNVVAPAGSTQAAVTNAETQAASDTANAENQIVQQNYATGRQNFFNAAGAEEQAPNVFGVANQANSAAGQEQKTAMTSQQNIDTQNNWWKSALLKFGTSVLQGPQMSSMGGGSTPSMPTSGSNDDEGIQDDASSSGSVESDAGSMDAGDMGGGAGAMASA
jgi:hypothetical protein